MTATSDRAILSSLRSQIDDLVERVTDVAAHYEGTTDSAVAEDLHDAERGLVVARRALGRAVRSLPGG